MNTSDLRAEFPVFERLAYLNAGTDGPVPRAGIEAARERMRTELERGRSGEAHLGLIKRGADSLRERLAELMGASPDEVALTHSTTDGVATVLSSLPLGRGDEVLTSDEEHPGLLAPLELARRKRGFGVRVVPFPELAAGVRRDTKLVACSHVSWVSGEVVDAAALASRAPLLLLDGAQGLGAVPVDVDALGCDFYAASGQKWLCGPDGSGSLFVRRAIADEPEPPWPNFGSLAQPDRPSELVFHRGARRFDLGISPGPSTAWALAAFDLLASAGWGAVFERGAAGAELLSARLRERGLEVASRGRSTLVSWRSDRAEEGARALAAAGIVVRHVPGRGLIRASVGAWTSEEDIARLANAVA